MAQPPANQFSGIFICYRRDDSSGHAGRLFDKLVDHFGKERIFMDIDTIEPGEDFVTVIENAVGSCEILIAIIGRHWLSSTGEGPGWFDNPNDFVRVEIATALRRNIRVIPVLVQRASMPSPQDLPDDLVALSRRNAVELSDVHWPNDVKELIRVMERIISKSEEDWLAEQEDDNRRVQAERQRRDVERTKAAANKLTPDVDQRRLADEAERVREQSEMSESKRSKVSAIVVVALIFVAISIWLGRTFLRNSSTTGQGPDPTLSVPSNSNALAKPTPTATSLTAPPDNETGDKVTQSSNPSINPRKKSASRQKRTSNVSAAQQRRHALEELNRP